MKDQVTIDEAIAMRGTEFIFMFNDGDTIKAYVKAFDPNVGLSCFTLEDETAAGHEMPPEENEDGRCVIGFNFKENPETLDAALRDLFAIRERGEFRPEDRNGFTGWGGANCSFK